MEIRLGNIGNAEVIYVKNKEKNYPHERIFLRQNILKP